MSDPKPFARQLGISAFSEMLGLGVSIGAVYGAHYAAPQQTRALIHRLAGMLGRYHGSAAEHHLASAQKIADFTLMNIGGLMNMGSQFAMHRYTQPPEERAPLAQELGRVLSGRLAGTLGAGVALVAAEHWTPRAMDRMERVAGKALGNHPRLGELGVSSLVQSVGALPGNVAVQLLYDKITGRTAPLQRSSA